jgi:hypothetical protein
MAGLAALRAVAPRTVASVAFLKMLMAELLAAAQIRPDCLG